MCEKKKNMHNQLTWPHIPLYTLVLCVHNRIAIIIGSLVSWAFVLSRLYPLSIIKLFCWSRLQWIEMKVKWLSSPSRSLDCLFLFFSYDEIIKTRQCILGDNFSWPHTHECMNWRLACLFFTVYVYIYIYRWRYLNMIFYRYTTKRWIRLTRIKLRVNRSVEASAYVLNSINSKCVCVCENRSTLNKWWWTVFFFFLENWIKFILIPNK